MGRHGARRTEGDAVSFRWPLCRKCCGWKFDALPESRSARKKGGWRECRRQCGETLFCELASRPALSPRPHLLSKAPVPPSPKFPQLPRDHGRCVSRDKVRGQPLRTNDSSAGDVQLELHAAPRLTLTGIDNSGSAKRLRSKTFKNIFSTLAQARGIASGQNDQELLAAVTSHGVVSRGHPQRASAPSREARCRPRRAPACH